MIIIDQFACLLFGILFLIMLINSLKAFPKFIPNPCHEFISLQTTNLINETTHQFSTIKIREITCKLKVNFARRVSPINKPAETQCAVQQIKKIDNLLKNLQQKKKPHFKATNLDEDMQMYQGYLNIFNSHTKKAHEKLLRNQIKLIQCVIQAKRQDLLNKFLSTNYRNRLANPQTLPLITKHCNIKILNHLNQILSSPTECQSLLQTITLMTEFNQLESFSVFIQQLQKKYCLNPKNTDSDYLITLLKSLPSPQSQFLTLYNFLFLNKSLPLYLMKSQFFGIHTENLSFHNLGQTFYQIRKFMRRYFAFYNKQLQSELNSNSLKTFQRQKEKSSKGSSLQTDVLCFLKALKYEDVRRQVEIDGFVVDFVIEGVLQKEKGISRVRQVKKQELKSTILEVMGSYHYTSRGRLKGRDVRKLILLGSEYREKKYNIKLIHFEDLNRSRGFRNKMELIRTTLQQKGQEINWQPQNKGFDSQWQLKQHYEEFK